jgi:hypothetical protein
MEIWCWHMIKLNWIILSWNYIYFVAWEWGAELAWIAVTLTDFLLSSMLMLSLYMSGCFDVDKKINTMYCSMFLTFWLWYHRLQLYAHMNWHNSNHQYDNLKPGGKHLQEIYNPHKYDLPHEDTQICIASNELHVYLLHSYVPKMPETYCLRINILKEKKKVVRDRIWL